MTLEEGVDRVPTLSLSCAIRHKNVLVKSKVPIVVIALQARCSYTGVKVVMSNGAMVLGRAGLALGPSHKFARRHDDNLTCVVCTNDILGNRLTKGTASYTLDALNRLTSYNNGTLATADINLLAAGMCFAAGAWPAGIVLGVVGVANGALALACAVMAAVAMYNMLASTRRGDAKRHRCLQLGSTAF